MGTVNLRNRLHEKINVGSRYTWNDYFNAVFIDTDVRRKTSFTDLMHPRLGFYTGENRFHNAKKLFEFVVDPLCAQFNTKFQLNDTLRDGPSATGVWGYHQAGLAVDLGFRNHTATKKQAYEWMFFNKCNVLDELLWEWTDASIPGGAYPSGEGGWIHVAIYITPDYALQHRKRTFKNVLNHVGRGVINLKCGSKPLSNEDVVVADRNQTNEDAGHADNSITDANGNPQQPQQNNLVSINEKSLDINVENLEATNVDVSWGARLNAYEQSDWIGLRQFLLYLATTYEPQSLVPFVELIPKFFLDEPKAQSFYDNQTQFEYRFTPTEKERFMRTKEKMTSLNQNGGIDMLTLDPFEDQKEFKKNPGDGTMDEDMRGGRFERNFGYRVFGSVVLSPGTRGTETSKAGSIGFKSLDIQSGLSTQQGMTLITIKLLDVQGNKFLDITSPWSFLLNAAQIGGDFFFRFGWQIRIPRQDRDINSIGYKFWNHPGWRVFGDSKSGQLEGLKLEIASRAAATDGQLTLTQSESPASLWYPGFSNREGVFTIDRRLDISHYTTISMINPELSIDSKDGSITASIQFRTNNAMANCLTPLYKAEKTSAFVNGLKGGQTNLYDLMKKFVADNYSFVQNDEKLVDKKGDAITPETSEGSQSWIKVKRLSNPDRTVDPSSIKITITNAMLEELNTNMKSVDTNIQLKAWLDKVLKDPVNNITMLGAGDISTNTANPSAGFMFIYDDQQEGRTNVRSADPGALGYVTTQNDINRMVLQDDVFSFRFRGSLVEDMKIERIENDTAATIQAKQNAAGEMVGNEAQSLDGEAGNSAVTDPNIKTTQAGTVSWSDKKRYRNILLSSMSNATIIAIGHPWLKLGYTVFIKGTGYFDGKYIVCRLKHEIDDTNKFVTEVNVVRTQHDADYAKHVEDLDTRSQLAMNNPGINIAETMPNPRPSNILTKEQFIPSNRANNSTAFPGR